MGKKALFVAIIWIVLAVMVFVLYLQREASPVKEFIAWALSVWSILTALGGLALLVSGWVIKHDFTNQKSKRREELRNQQAKLREKYSGCQEIPKLLWQLYEKAKELVISDPNKSAIIAKIPDMERTLADSGFFSPSNRSLAELQKFAQSIGNPLVGHIKKPKPNKLEAITNAFISILLNTQGAIDAEGYGALRLVHADQTCKDILSKITELQIGLPDKIHSEIDKHIHLSTAIADLSYFNLSDKMPPQFKTMLFLFKPASDSILNEISSKLAQIIEAFLSGEDVQ